MAWTLQKSGKGERIAAIFSEVTDEDSNKTLNFPSDIAGLAAGYLELQGIRIEYTAVVGGAVRQPAIQVLTGAGDVVLEVTLTRTCAASASQIYNAAPWIDVAIADHETLPSGITIPQGARLKVWDKNAIDPTHDRMYVHVLGLLHNVV